ncbi:MAG: hypothetical protein OHK0046_47370 [Anaerolineae bacterium]
MIENQYIAFYRWSDGVLRSWPEPACGMCNGTGSYLSGSGDWVSCRWCEGEEVEIHLVPFAQHHASTPPVHEGLEGTDMGGGWIQYVL